MAATKDGVMPMNSDSLYRKRPLDGAKEEEKGQDARFKRQAVAESGEKGSWDGGASPTDRVLPDSASDFELQKYDDPGRAGEGKTGSRDVWERKNSSHSSSAASEGEDTLGRQYSLGRSGAQSGLTHTYSDEQGAGDDQPVSFTMGEHDTAPGVPNVSSSKSQKSTPGSYSSGSRSIIARCIITSKEAGVIIGKLGKNIADIRETSGAKVMISEQVQGAQDRILTISGSVGSATKAFSSISQIVSEDSQGDDPVSRGASRKATIKLLVPHIKMGIIIGKSGSRIREIQEQSSARILASEEMLPDSTERVVTIIGSPESIQIAIYSIILALQDFVGDDFAFIPYKPQPTGYLHIPGRGGFPPGASVYGKQHVPFPSQPAHPEHLQAYYNQFDVAQHNYQLSRAQMPPHPPHPGAYQSIQLQQIFIPNEMVGSIIGKQGCKINEIRQLSGCHIKIAEARHASPDRLVTIIGSAEANQMALFLLYDRLESEKSRLESIRSSTAATRT